LRGFHRRLIGFDRRLELRDQRLLSFVLLTRRGELGLEQRGDTRQVTPCVFQIGLVFRLIRPHLVQLRLVRPRIDLNQWITGTDHLTFPIHDLGDVAVHSALDGDLVECSDVADTTHNYREVFCFRCGSQDGHRASRRTALALPIAHPARGLRLPRGLDKFGAAVTAPPRGQEKPQADRDGDDSDQRCKQLYWTPHAPPFLLMSYGSANGIAAALGRPSTN